MNAQDQNTEAAIVAAGANVAPRVTPADLQANIASEHYFTAWNGIQGACDSGELHQTTHEYDTLTKAPPAATTYDATRLLTFCVVVLRNGFTVTGESACASSANFNAEIGRRVARENAIAKIWPLMGYALREQLSK